MYSTSQWKCFSIFFLKISILCFYSSLPLWKQCKNCTKTELYYFLFYLRGYSYFLFICFPLIIFCALSLLGLCGHASDICVQAEASGMAFTTPCCFFFLHLEYPLPPFSTPKVLFICMHISFCVLTDLHVQCLCIEGMSSSCMIVVDFSLCSHHWHETSLLFCWM